MKRRILQSLVRWCECRAKAWEERILDAVEEGAPEEWERAIDRRNAWFDLRASLEAKL